jgi:DNA (cytosine-5)-methyltransferase 1
MNYLDLFSGGGGIALGFEGAGFTPIALIDSDKDCCKTLKFNRPEWNIICRDIKDINFNRYNNIDLITAGIPCQAFSYAGKKLGLGDTRGTLFYEAAQAIKIIKPAMFIIENVKGLKSHNAGLTLKIMVTVFGDLGYTVDYKILNALNYNVAQKRERLFIVGIKDNLNINFKFPEPNNNILTLKDALINAPKSAGFSYSKKKYDVLKHVSPGGCWRDLPLNIQKEYMGASYYQSGGRTGIAKRLSWDEPCLTLTCSPAQKQTERCHPDEIRPLTIREYARIQTFPDNWDFQGSISSQYKQIGNAVPVNLAHAMAKASLITLQMHHH